MNESDFNDLENLVFELRNRVDRLASREPCDVFGRNFRIGMFLLTLGFVAVAGHWILAIAAYIALKDAVFRRDGHEFE